MRAHLAAIAAKLDVDYPVDLFASEPGRVPQWLVVEAPGWGSDPDVPLSSESSAFETEIRVKAIAGTPAGASIMLDNARANLPGPVAVTGRAVRLRWVRSEFIDLDTVTIPATNRHPAIGVDTYLLTSQPT